MTDPIENIGENERNTKKNPEGRRNHERKGKKNTGPVKGCQVTSKVFPEMNESCETKEQIIQDLGSEWVFSDLLDFLREMR